LDSSAQAFFEDLLSARQRISLANDCNDHLRKGETEPSTRHGHKLIDAPGNREPVRIYRRVIPKLSEGYFAKSVWIYETALILKATDGKGVHKHLDISNHLLLHLAWF
jgi:hypothetical protein